jgi:hypothetical protein
MVQPRLFCHGVARQMESRSAEARRSTLSREKNDEKEKEYT